MAQNYLVGRTIMAALCEGYMAGVLDFPTLRRGNDRAKREDVFPDGAGTRYREIILGARL